VSIIGDFSRNQSRPTLRIRPNARGFLLLLPKKTNSD
jgi:hypothetical protein